MIHVLLFLLYAVAALEQSEAGTDKMAPDFKLMINYAFAIECVEIWRNQTFPPWPNHSATILRKGIYEKKTTLSAYVATNAEEKMIVVAFRSAQTKTLWSFNMQMWLSQSHALATPSFLEEPNQKLPANIYLHHGFQNLYLSIRDEMLETVKMVALELPDYSIVFTGASLGASLAEIAAVDFAFNVPDCRSRVRVINFAPPRTGNAVWANFANSLIPLDRLVRIGDPVPYVPPISLGYLHPFKEHTIFANGTIVPCPPNRDGTGECARHDLKQLSIKKHLTKNYVALLEQHHFECVRKVK